MKKPARTSLVIAILTCIFSLSHTSASASSVWKVSSDKTSLYIGGTIHILTPEDYPLPDEYNQAFKQASTIVFETDMAAVNTPEFQQDMLAKMAYTNGQTVSSELNDTTMQALQAHLKQRGIPLAAVSGMKPNLLAITLSLIELQGMGFTSIGVDQYYSNMAAKQNKPQVGLETPAQQLAFLQNMGGDDKNAMIEYTLRDIKAMPEMISELRKFWLEGDMKGLSSLAITPFKTDFPLIYQDLIVTRNDNWMPQIETMLANKEVELILVGALHLAGSDSVLAQLAAKGYKIEQL